MRFVYGVKSLDRGQEGPVRELLLVRGGDPVRGDRRRGGSRRLQQHGDGLILHCLHLSLLCGRRKYYYNHFVSVILTCVEGSVITLAAAVISLSVALLWANIRLLAGTVWE